MGLEFYMQPFKQYDLNASLKKQYSLIEEKINSLSNEELMANDFEVLTENLYQEFFIEPLFLFDERFEKRKILQGKVRKFIDPFYYDLREPGVVYADGIIATFVFPYSGDKSLFCCRASQYFLGGYPEVEISPEEIIFKYEKTLDEMAQENARENLFYILNKDVETIKKGITFVNDDVNKFNDSLKFNILNSLNTKKDKVKAFYAISSMFEVPIEKKEYAQKHIPLKRKIVPINHKYEQKNYFGILEKDYLDILESIKHTLSTYERTPNSYKMMHEEDLRNTLLATLNATYKGEAVGEAFRNNGKTDICIERKNRSAFVAECKIWTGKKALQEAVEQLDSYLTWRDCKTALIYFVRKKNYISILDSLKSALSEIDEIRDITEIDKNEYECLYLSKSNPGQKIKIRIMLFNLYCSSK